MISLKNYLPIITIILLWASPSVAELKLSITAIDSLKLPFTLTELLVSLDQNFAIIDRPVWFQRKWNVIRDYYNFQDSKQKIILLIEVRNNLKTIQTLNRKRQENATIEDVAFFNSRHVLISKELDLLQARQQCRSSLLTMLQLCHVTIYSGDINETQEIAQDINSGRE